MATTRRAARSRTRGRTQFALALLCFMSVAAVVVWRRSTGTGLTQDTNELERELKSIRAERLMVEHALDSAMSRQAVVPAAERRLGLHVATEVQTRTIVDVERGR